MLLTPETDDVRVLVVAENPLARAGLASLLSDQVGCIVAGQATSDEELLLTLETQVVDALAWDLGWEPEIALEKITELGDDAPPVLALLPDEDSAAEAWSAGVRGLLPNNADVDTIRAALASVAQGLVVLPPSMMEAIVPSNSRVTEAPIDTLTPREQEVLQLVAEGLANKAIAHQLQISDHTVKFHVNAILTKLGAQSRTEAVVRATRMGLILL